MKKAAISIPFIIMLIVLAASIISCIDSIVSINDTFNELANNPSSSGIDYFGIGWAYGIGLFILSIFGLILSVINTKILKINSLKYISLASIFLFGALIITSILMFCV